MKVSRFFFPCFLLFLFSFFLFVGCHEDTPPVPSANAFVYKKGTQLFSPDGSNYIINGISLSCPIDGTLNWDKLERIYDDIQALGFNVARIHLDYALLEEDSAPYVYKSSGWDWLDASIKIAKDHNIRIKLDIYRPQGGVQATGQGADLWKNQENQKRLLAMWTAIAQRYATEPTILGYNLLGEPSLYAPSNQAVTFSLASKWKQLAQEIADSIQKQDPNHLLFVERICSTTNENGVVTNWDWNSDPNQGFVFLSAPNIVYEFHMYDPYWFTHQSEAEEDSEPLPYLVYPNEFLYSTQNSKKTWLFADRESPSIRHDTDYWQELTGVLIPIQDPKITSASICFEISDLGSEGMAWLDEICVKEYDENKNFVRDILYLDMNQSVDFSLWEESGKGTVEYTATGGTKGIGGTVCVYGTVGDAVATLNGVDFPVKQGYFYQISAFAGGSNLQDSSIVRVRLDFHHTQNYLPCNKSYLEESLQDVLTFLRKKKVPAILGEFGTNNTSFVNNRGGERWVGDMLDLIRELHLHSVFFAYDADSFGVYHTNASLLALLKERVE